MLSDRSSVLLQQPLPSAGNVHARCYLCGPEGHPSPATSRGAIREYSRDGRIYSICRTCLAIIAIGQRDAELDPAEEQHACVGSDLPIARLRAQPRLQAQPRLVPPAARRLVS